MKEFKTANTGTRVIINSASVKEVQQLKNTLLKELKNSNFNIKLKDNAQDILQKDIDFTGILDFIKNVLISIDTSEEFNEAIFACLKYCTYNTTYKITLDLFDNPEIPRAREDYYEILYKCIEENLRPFIQSLVSTFKTLVQQGSIDQLFKLM